MGSTVGTALAGAGIGIATAGILLLLHVSGLMGAPPAAELLLVAVGVFLVGIPTFGYGAGKRTGH